MAVPSTSWARPRMSPPGTAHPGALSRPEQPCSRERLPSRLAPKAGLGTMSSEQLAGTHPGSQSQEPGYLQTYYVPWRVPSSSWPARKRLSQPSCSKEK